MYVLLFLLSWANASEYIVGGQNVAPWDPVRASTVGIFEPSGDGRTGSLCTGTLIRANTVLTAAHCLGGEARPTVIFGPDLHAPDAVHRPADQVAVNDKWATHAGKGMDQGDIALVKFSGGLPKGYHKVPVLGSDQEIHAGDKVVLAGYGIDNARAKTGAGRLRQTEVNVAKTRTGRSEMILDQSNGRGACHGDSGGPAYLRRNGKLVLAGVTNRGYPNRAPDDCAHQVVYTKVPAYKPWIQAREQQMDHGSPEAVQLAHRMRVRRFGHRQQHVAKPHLRSASTRRAALHRRLRAA